MNRMLPFFFVGALVCFALMRSRRRKHSQAAEDIKESTAQAIDAVDDRLLELRKRARKLRGDAKQKLQDQVQELESAQTELKHKLEEVRGEARKLLAHDS